MFRFLKPQAQTENPRVRRVLETEATTPKNPAGLQGQHPLNATKLLLGLSKQEIENPEPIEGEIVRRLDVYSTCF